MSELARKPPDADAEHREDTEERRSQLRREEGADAVSNVELFYDLVFVFAVTQLSHFLVKHATVEGAVQAAVLLAMIWQVWVYSTWAINYLDPARTRVRTVLLLLTFGALVMAAAVPEAFHDRGMTVAIAYVTMQVGRALFMIYALRNDSVQPTFLRITAWSAASGAIVIVGAIEHGMIRAALWAAAVVLDLAAASFGFYVPGLGGSETTEWTISGSHFAERCQAFVLIALGESLIVTGAYLTEPHVGLAEIGAFSVAFAGTVGLWWIYFDSAAEDSADHLRDAEDPGWLARSAFHWVHPLIVAGIIVAAAADEEVLKHPHEPGETATTAFLLAGPALYLLGHAAFKLVLWHRFSWQRVGGAAALGALAAAAPHVSALMLGVLVLAVLVVVAVLDRVVPHEPVAISR